MQIRRSVPHSCVHKPRLVALFVATVLLQGAAFFVHFLCTQRLAFSLHGFASSPHFGVVLAWGHLTKIEVAGVSRVMTANPVHMCPRTPADAYTSLSQRDTRCYCTLEQIPEQCNVESGEFGAADSNTVNNGTVGSVSCGGALGSQEGMEQGLEPPSPSPVTSTGHRWAAFRTSRSGMTAVSVRAGLPQLAGQNNAQSPLTTVQDPDDRMNRHRHRTAHRQRPARIPQTNVFWHLSDNQHS